MNNVKFIENLIQPYCPQSPFDQLVIEMNRIYHHLEADIYDTQHPEVYEQLPPIWKEMSKKTTECFGLQALRILDFGCGTGFEAQQLLQNIPVSSIAALTCYDPSPKMLEKCRTKITPLYPNAMFCPSLEEALTSNTPYTLLLTNSVLHHLPDVTSTIRSLLPLLDSNALWLAGHEPSAHFYNNIECVTNLEAFEAYNQKRWRSHSYFYQLLKRIIRGKSSIYAKTAQEVVRMGLFKRQPPAYVIDRIVDFHVAHSTEEMSVGRGFDISALQQDFQAFWKLVWLKTYSFMGPFYEGRLNGRWADSCRELARCFPNDGANFCMIWQKI